MFCRQHNSRELTNLQSRPIIIENKRRNFIFSTDGFRMFVAFQTVKRHFWIKFENLFLVFWLFNQICGWVSYSAGVHSVGTFTALGSYEPPRQRHLESDVMSSEWPVTSLSSMCHVHCFHLLCEKALCFRFLPKSVLDLEATAFENPKPLCRLEMITPSL